ncbi:ankyrin repeat domain-containing protein [Rickettsia endosymbiont of Pantilius tunicatus]|uniref:ankyrin repeat domain-containing protein n=1 Tax=Rickettsia endosymbiont of Pantilius tunicatus TaxID=3066267 RepID=UPI00376ECCA3
MGNTTVMSTELSRPLFVAASKGDIEAVNNLIAIKPEILIDIDWVDPETNCTAIGIAALKGHLKMVKFLLAAKENDLVGSTSQEILSAQAPLDLAGKNNNLDIAKLLLEYGERCNFPENKYGNYFEKMIKSSELAHKIFSLEDLDINDIQNLEIVKNDLYLKEILITTFKNDVSHSKYIPGTGSLKLSNNLSAYYDSIKNIYQNKFEESLAEELLKVITEVEFQFMNKAKHSTIEFTKNLFEDSNYDFQNYLKSMIENPEKQRLKEIIRNNSNLEKIIDELTDNKYLDMELRDKLNDFIESDCSSDLDSSNSSDNDLKYEVQNIGEI